jgi:hypothetical protein
MLARDFDRQLLKAEVGLGLRSGRAGSGRSVCEVSGAELGSSKGHKGGATRHPEMAATSVLGRDRIPGLQCEVECMKGLATLRVDASERHSHSLIAQALLI